TCALPICKPEMLTHRCDQATKIIRWQHRRGATSDEDRRDCWRVRSQHSSRQLELGDRGVDVAGAAGSWLGAELGGGVSVEIAVAATCRAERDVNVDAERSEREL